jgi:hypothetical protein
LTALLLLGQQVLDPAKLKRIPDASLIHQV